MKLLIFDQAMTEQVYAGRKTMARIYMEKQPIMQSHVSYAEVMENCLLDARSREHKFPYKSQFPLREWWRKAGHGYEYKTDRQDMEAKDWQSPAMMPLKAARLWLEITEVYCERFSEMHEAEFDADGMRPMKRIAGTQSFYNYDRNNYSAKSKLETMHTYYMTKYKYLRMDDWAWIVHFQPMSGL